MPYRLPCALCGLPAEHINTGNLTQIVTCPHCVRYEISDRILSELRDVPARKAWPGELLSRAAKRHAGAGPTMRLLTIQGAGVEAERQRQIEAEKAKGE